MHIARKSHIYLTLALLAGGQFTLNTSVWMLTGLLGPLATDFGTSVGAAGQVITVFTLAYAIGAPLLVVALARFDQRMLLIMALAVSSIANLAAAFAPSFGLLLLLRGIAGAVDGLYGATATAAVLALAPPMARGRFLALLNTGLTLAMFVGVPLATLVGGLYGWRAPFMIIAGFAAVSAAGLLLFCPQISAPLRTTLAERVAVLAAPGALPTLLIGTLSYLGMFTVYAYIGPILDASAGISPTTMSSMLLAFGFAAVVGNWIGGQSADKWGEARTLGFSLAGVAPLLAALPFLATTPIFAAILLFVWGLVHYAGISPLQLLISRMAPGNAGIAVALMNSFIYGGVALGAAVGGYIFDRLPVLALGSMGALLKIAALLLLIRVVTRYLRRTGAAAAPSAKRTGVDEG